MGAYTKTTHHVATEGPYADKAVVLALSALASRQAVVIQNLSSGTLFLYADAVTIAAEQAAETSAHDTYTASVATADGIRDAAIAAANDTYDDAEVVAAGIRDTAISDANDAYDDAESIAAGLRDDAISAARAALPVARKVAAGARCDFGFYLQGDLYLAFNAENGRAAVSEFA